MCMCRRGAKGRADCWIYPGTTDAERGCWKEQSSGRTLDKKLCFALNWAESDPSRLSPLHDGEPAISANHSSSLAARQTCPSIKPMPSSNWCLYPKTSHVPAWDLHSTCNFFSWKALLTAASPAVCWLGGGRGWALAGAEASSALINLCQIN